MQRAQGVLAGAVLLLGLTQPSTSFSPAALPSPVLAPHIRCAGRAERRPFARGHKVAYRIGRATTRILMAEDGPEDFIPVDGGSLAGDKRLPIIPIAAGTGGILFPECTQQIKVSGEELSVVRSIEGEQLPLFGYCTVGEDGKLLPVGTMALLKKVEWSQLTPEEGGAPLEEGKPWTPWGASDDQSKALLRCVGVQRFRILSLETREPYPIARVRLFTDEEAEHKEPEFDELLSEVENVATEVLTEVLRIGGELVGEIAQDEIKDARDRMAKFAPGGPGTEQIVMSPLGPMGWKLGEHERRELQSFALADIQNANESSRYHILECRSTITRFKRVTELLAPELSKLAAQNSLKKLSMDDDSK